MHNKKFILASQEDKNWCEANNVKMTFPGQIDYPEALLGLPYRPALLFYIGQPVWLSHNLISVVGSRVPSSQSLAWLEDVLSAKLLARKKIAIVSGGARGVDQKAHQLALISGQPTIVVLPSGLRHVYPKNLNEWVPAVIDSGGCFISQFLPSQKMEKRLFRERNRVIAALSPFTLVVECRRRSGTMLTANYALEYEREIGVMPTFPGAQGMGGLDLLCDKVATPMRDELDMELVLNRLSKSI